MDTAKLQPARLIPITGIKGALDQERRATSALLAVLTAVPDFSRTLLRPIGAPAGKVSAYIEPEFEVLGKKIRPDGLITVERAGRTWTALVEVKTGKNVLDAAQITAYLDLTRSEKVDALITISNEVLTLSGVHPTRGLDARKTRSTNLAHLSWIRIITEAMIHTEHKGVKDTEQAWILNELVRFLQSDASGANEFDDMGPNWVGVRDAVVDGTVTASDKRLPEIIHNYESLIRFATLKLSARLGVAVSEVAPRRAKEDPKKFLADSIHDFISTKTLTGTIRIPEAASDLTIVADLRAAQILCSVEVAAPRDGRNLTRINWLLRQLKDAPSNVRVEVFTKHGRVADAVALSSAASQDPAQLIPQSGREISSFRLVTIVKMGSKRGNGTGSFIGTVISAVEETYAKVLQPLRPWTAKAPKLSESVVELIPEPGEVGFERSLT